jgi:hypothetical protein
VSEARPGDVRVDWRIASAAAAALVVLFTFQNYVRPRAFARAPRSPAVFQLQIINWGSWLALSPWIFAAPGAGAARVSTRRPHSAASAHRLRDLDRPGRPLRHAALARRHLRLHRASGRRHQLDRVDVGSNLLRYSMISAAYHAVAYHHEVRDRDVRAARLEAALVQAKLDSLQGRLQPHFLFNTLNSIAALIRDQPEAAEQMLGSLSELLRASLHAEPGREVTLESELDLVRQYVSIQQMRFSDRPHRHDRRRSRRAVRAGAAPAAPAARRERDPPRHRPARGAGPRPHRRRPQRRPPAPAGGRRRARAW